MNPLYEWYKNSCESIKRYEQEKYEQDPSEFDEKVEEVMCGWKSALTIIEISNPEFKVIDMLIQEIQKSFTQEQIDHICYQIGDWYLMMKPLLEGKHNLGHMKERLKIMICGE